jgi:hypothetical protein
LHTTDIPQTVIKTVEILWQPHSEVLEHPPYTLDPSPFMHHQLVSPKDAFRDHPFNTDHKANELVHKSFTTQPVTFFLKAYRSLFTVGKSKMTIRRIMCKNDAPTHFLSLRLH